MIHHFTHMCLHRTNNHGKVHAVNYSDFSDNDSKPDSFFIGTVHHKGKVTDMGADEWFVDAKINKVKVRFKIVSGAQCKCAFKSLM